MSIDFAALTQAVVAGLPDVRSCLIVSRDGLALGASPATEEGRTLNVWTRIAALGDVERGFVTVRDEVWVFCRRGAYGAVATGASSEGATSVENQEAAVSAWARRLMSGAGLERATSGPGPAPAEASPNISFHEPPETSLDETTAPAERETEEGHGARSEDDSTVDRVELSREFAAILAEHEEDKP